MISERKGTRNFLLITVDSLRADRLGVLGHENPSIGSLTPNIDELSKKGCLFNNASSNGPYTNASVSSLLTGTLPMYKGNTLVGDRATIAEILKSRGWTTAMFHPNPNIHRYADYRKGFVFYEDLCENLFGGGTLINNVSKLAGRIAGFVLKLWGREDFALLGPIRAFSVLQRSSFTPRSSTAAKINERVVDWLENAVTPFFLWIHYMDVHMPYFSSSSIFNRISGEEYDTTKIFAIARAVPKGLRLSTEDKKWWLAAYESSVNYLDQGIHDLLEELKQRDLLENTYVMLTADHGDEFHEHEHFGHGDDVRPVQLYEELLHVPLVVVGPGVRRKIRRDHVSLIDVAPTILDLLHIKYTGRMQGRSLANLLKKDSSVDDHYPIICEATCPTNPVEYARVPISYRLFSYRFGRWKYIHYANQTGKDELYDLENDPRETVNLRDSHLDLAGYFHAEILKHSYQGIVERVRSRIQEQKVFRR